MHILTSQRFDRLVMWRSQKKTRVLIYLFIGILLITIGVTLNKSNTRQYLSDLRHSMEQEENTLQAHLEGDIFSKALLMRGFAATIAANPDISQERYASLAAQLVKDNPSIINIAAAPDMVVRYVYPLEPNKAVLGFDYRTSAAQLKDIERAHAINGTILSGPINLVQGGQGFILRSPIFRTDEITGIRTFWGIVSIVINMDLVNENLSTDDFPTPLEVALRKSDEGPDAKAFYGDDRVFASEPLLANITLPNGVWIMGIIPKGGWPTHADNYLSFMAFLFSSGLLLFLLALYIGQLLEERKEAEHILTSAIDAIDGGFVLYDADDNFATCNREYKEIYKLTTDLFVPGMPFELILRESMRRGEYPEITDDQEHWIKQRLEHHRMANILDEHYLPDGRWIRVSESKLADGSRVGIHIDITELKLAKEAAEKANKAKSVFLNTLSHELRTPLTIILGYARILLNIDALPTVKELQALLASPPLDIDKIKAKLDIVLAQVANQSEKINGSGIHLLKLITDILDYSKVDAGEMKFEKQNIPVSPLINSVLEDFKDLAREKSLRLYSETNDEIVFADELRTKQVLINLVGNALKFTDAGSVTVKTRQVGTDVEFIVEDTGCGIPESEISAVYAEFYQVDGSDTRKSHGTGLGLSIVKRMVELQGGDVGLSSVLGKGSAFSFTLPSKAA